MRLNRYIPDRCGHKINIQFCKIYKREDWFFFSCHKTFDLITADACTVQRMHVNSGCETKDKGRFIQLPPYTPHAMTSLC